MIAGRPVRPILAFGPGVWGWPDFAGSPRYHLWSLAGRGWPVLYVEPPVEWRWSALHWQAPDRPFRVLRAPRTPPFAFSAMPTPMVATAWRAITARRMVAAAVGDLCRWSSAPHPAAIAPPPVVWLGAPWHGAIAARLPRAWPRVAHVYDELAASPSLRPAMRPTLARWESALLDQCALVLCSSQPQVDARRTRPAPALPSPVELLENAVRDDFLLDPAPGPTDGAARALLDTLRTIPRPRVVYGGVADLRVNAALLAGALSQHPDAHLVFLGVKAPSFDDEPLRALGPRVHYLGLVPYGAYPRLYREADVLVLAHHIDDFTRGMYPEKLNEYLTSGRPIVSVALAEVARVAGQSASAEALRLATTSDEFAAGLGAALAEGDNHRLRDERRRLVAGRTWSAAADRLEGMLRALP